MYAALGARSLPARPRSAQPALATSDPPQPGRQSSRSTGDSSWGRSLARSRSPARRGPGQALPGLRQDAPGRLAGQRPPLSLATALDRARAVEDLTEGFYASSSASAVRARRTCYTRLLGLWGATPLPLTVDKVLWLAAGLKARRYRSAPSVLSQIRVDAERGGQDISASLRRTFADAARSCKRGLGPAVSAKPLNFEDLRSLPVTPGPWHAHGPIGPAAAMVVGAWWLLRETEAANLRAAHVVFANTRGVLTVELMLPASKGDQEARGVTRAQSCICRSAARLPECPAHAALRQMCLLRASFPHRFSAGGPQVDLPFFPQASGAPSTKIGFAATITEAARRQGIEEVSPDGAERISGHSLRVTGARGLATLGVDTYAIQLLGRWGSGVVLRYVKAAAVTSAAAAARAASTAVSLQSLASGASAAGLTAENCSEKSVTELIELHLPGAVARAREGVVQELRAELARRAPSRSTSSSSSSTSSSSSGPGASDGDAPPSPPQPPAQLPPRAEPPSVASPDLSLNRPGAEEGGCKVEQVSNEKHLKRHAVLVGSPCPDPSAWITGCGWKFGRSAWAGPVNPDHTRCRRCAQRVGPAFQ